MRQGLKIHLASNAVMNLIFILFLYAIVEGQQLTRISLGVTLLVVCCDLIFSVALMIYIDLRMKPDWFKTQEELQEMRRKTEMEFREVNQMCKIIGDHEAIKMHRAGLERIRQALMEADEKKSVL